MGDLPQKQAGKYNVENLTAPRYQPGQSGNPGGLPGRPKGSSLLAPVLRKLADEPNEHGEGKMATALAGRLIEAADVLATGVPKGVTIDVGPILKLMERTDPEIKQSRVHITDDGSVPLE